MHAIRCASCGRRIALSFEKYSLRNKAYCSELCLIESPPLEEAVRGDQWEFLRAQGHSPVAIAQRYGSPHGQVYKTLARLQEVPQRLPFVEAFYAGKAVDIP